jgi:hypothetical protein
MRATTKRTSGLWTAPMLLLLGCLSTPVLAQPRPAERARGWPIDTVLARFEADARGNVVNGPGFDVTYSMIGLPDRYIARKDSLLDGLEHLAMSSSNADVRIRATYALASAGKGGANWSAVPRVMHRLARIYRSTSHPDVRSPIRDQLPLQAERAAAAALLRSIAREPDDANDGTGPHGYFSYGDPRTEALSRLSEMGEEGRAVLQAMHRSGEVRTPQGRIWMEEFARRGFPVEDTRERLRP